MPWWIYLVGPAALLAAVLAIHWCDGGDRVEHLARRLDDALDVEGGAGDSDGRSYGAKKRRP